MSSDFHRPELPAIGLVADLTSEERAILSSYGTFRFAKAGTLLIQEGEVQNALYFVISGLLHAKRSDGSHEALVGAIHRGEWFGEVNMFDPGVASATVVTIEDAQIWQVSREDLQEFFQNYPGAALQLTVGVATVLSKRLRAVTARVTEHDEYAALKAAFSGGAAVFPGFSPQ